MFKQYLALNWRKLFNRLLIATVFLVSGINAAMAQLHIEVTGVGLNRYPIHLATFENEQLAPVAIAKIIQADLERSGEFHFPIIANLPQEKLNAGSNIDFNAWKRQGADFLVSAEISQTGAEQFNIKFMLHDSVEQRSIGGKSFNTSKANLRLTAHKMADFIYQTIIGVPGVFSTRIAYVTKSKNQHNLWVADADGENAKSALSSSLPIISPTWSPSGDYLAYVSFEQKKPIIYVQNINSGERKIIANFKGSNSAPAWSPDERYLAVTLTQDGFSQIYHINIANGETSRLTNSNSIDTEPVYSADGKFIYFVSDRGGQPQIYRMPANGGAAKRITFSGNYNISPDISDDGKYLTYISRVNAKYIVMLQNLADNSSTALTNDGSAESPSFAPNSKLIMFANKNKGKEVLTTISIDGQTSTELASAGRILEPSWGPFLTR